MIAIHVPARKVGRKPRWSHREGVSSCRLVEQRRALCRVATVVKTPGTQRSYVAGHPGAAAMQLRAMIALAFSEKGDRWLIWPLAFPA